MLQVRRSIFETNSSSVHSLTFISEEEMAGFLAGELLFDQWGCKLVTREVAETNADNKEYKHIYSKDDLYDLGCEYGGEAFAESKELPDGGVAHYICYYGHD